jgi:hypothetical protein
VAFNSQQFGCGTVSQVICQPINRTDILVRVTSAGGTVVLSGGSIPAGPDPTGFRITPADGIVRLPIAQYGGAANPDDSLWARSIAGGSATVTVLQAT